MIKIKNWKKSAMVFTLATGLLVTGTSLTTINTSHAAPNTKVVVPKHHQSHQQTIINIEKLASQGKTVNSENFGLQSKTDDIIKKWGKPDEGSDENWLYYSKRGMDIVAEKGKVVKIYSTDKSYYDITYKEVKRTLGKPIKEVKGQDGHYITYKAGTNTLEFAFYYNNEDTKPSTLAGVNVF
jgi:Skp family chaperone for outer membrane proteins